MKTIKIDPTETISRVKAKMLDGELTGIKFLTKDDDDVATIVGSPVGVPLLAVVLVALKGPRPVVAIGVWSTIVDLHSNS